jgi:hypothetical protein
LWNKLVQIDTNIIREPAHVPVILAKDYTFDALRKATENWRYPAIVRGLFNNTVGMNKWSTPDYLPSRLGEFTVPVVRGAVVGKVQNDRVNMKFKEAFDELVGDPESKYYLFFPVKSRFGFNGSDIGSLKALQDAVNDVVLNDLELKRIWPGFGTKAHSTFFGSQIIVGQGTDDETTTGTGWHCAMGNNWFIQVSLRYRASPFLPRLPVYLGGVDAQPVCVHRWWAVSVGTSWIRSTVRICFRCVVARST